MSATASDVALERAWRQQSVWSQVASRLRKDLQRNRILVLSLTVLAAVLSAVAIVAGVDAATGKVLAAAGGAAVGFAALVRERVGKDAIQNWTRSRSVAEGLKSEVYLYLTRVGDYAEPEGAQILDDRVVALEEAASDLAVLRAGVEGKTRELPAVNDVDSYVRERIDRQITDYYRPRAAELRKNSDRIRAAQRVLAGLGVVAGAVAAIVGTDAAAVWVPVLATIGTALAAHGAAERLDFQVVEFLRTADQLERLRDRRGAARTMGDDDLIRAAEQVISVQNEGWMAKLSSEPEN